MRRSLGVAWVCLVLGLVMGCSGGGSSDAVTAVIGPEGGRIELPSGLLLEVPPGALAEATEISLRPLSEADLSAASFVSSLEDDLPVLLDGFVARPDGLVFATPAAFSIPVDGNTLQGRPLIHLSGADPSGPLSPRAGTVDFDPVVGRAVFSLDGFSTHTGGPVEPADIGHSDCVSPETACRCGAFRAETIESDTIVDGCQRLASTVRITYLDCPGQPVEESTLTEEVDCLPDPDPDRRRPTAFDIPTDGGRPTTRPAGLWCELCTATNTLRWPQRPGSASPSMALRLPWLGRVRRRGGDSW
jgi:hypothetical protein